MEFQALLSVDMLARVTVILAVGWLAHLCLSGRNPHWRVLLWRCVTAAVLIMPLVSSVMPSLRVNVPGELLPLAYLPAVTVAGETASSGIGLYWPLLVWSAVALLLAARKVKAIIGLGLKAANSPLAGPQAEQVLRQVAAQLRYTGRVTLKTSSLVQSPLVFGFARPVILIPDNLPASEETLRAVLAHELAHLGNSDLRWLYLIRLCQTVFWFHPLAWGIAGAHESACERVCDAVAAGCVGDVSQYSSTLARMALHANDNRQLAFGGISMVRKPQIIKRLEALKSRIGAARPSRSRIAAFAVLVVLSLALVSAIELISERGALLAAQEEKSAAKSDQSKDEWTSVTQQMPTMPQLKTAPPKPQIPAAVSKQLAETGGKAITILEIFVDEQGQVEKKLTNVATSCGFDELDKLALEWAKQMEYKPALNYGKPVKVKVRLPLVWAAK